MGDAEESADLIDYYCGQVEEADGFVRPMGRITPVERNTDVLRPYGVFACIAPFNFPAGALGRDVLRRAHGGQRGGLQAGRGRALDRAPTVRRSIATPGCRPACSTSWPAGAKTIGDALWQHPGVDGVVFTGSKAVGLRIHAGHQCALDQAVPAGAGRKERRRWSLPSADLDAAAEGVMRSAFSLQNQKCSATSRVYVDRAVADAVPRAADREDPRDPDGRSHRAGRLLRTGHQPAVGRAVRARRGPGSGARAPSSSAASGSAAGSSTRGHFVAPTIARLPLSQLALPRGAVRPVPGGGRGERARRGDRGVERARNTGSPPASSPADPAEVERFFDEIEAGVCYANKRSGATTGAWPGAQAFCGWKGSGSTGKGGCGPYYVAQFLREQNRTVIDSGSHEGVTNSSNEGPRARLSQDRGSPSRAQGPGDRRAATRSGPPPATSRSTRSSSPTGRGPMVEDVDGNRYLDFMAGIAVSSTGYGHPKVVAAIKEAADRFLHICGSDFYYEGMAALCERLARLAPGPSREAGLPHQLRHRGRSKAAIKLARYATRRTAIIAFRGAFHGRTHRRRDAHLQQGAPARRVRARCSRTCITFRSPTATAASSAPTKTNATGAASTSIEQELFTRQLDPGDVAAIFVEPVQGEGGYVVPPPGWLRDLRELCDRHGILLVADEVQSRRRPHREDVGLRARGRRARHPAHRQGARLRACRSAR